MPSRHVSCPTFTSNLFCCRHAIFLTNSLSPILAHSTVEFPSLESAPSGFFVVENALLLNYQENPFGPMKGISMKVKDSEEAKPAIEGSSSINAQLRSGYYTLEEEIDASGEVVPGELVHYAAAGGSPGLGRKLLGGRELISSA